MNYVAPPGWMQRLLRILLPPRDRETIAGDLFEEFCESKVPELGSRRAGIWYLRHASALVLANFARHVCS